MSDAKLWIDEVGCTATITGANVSYTMPLLVFEDMRDIIVNEAEKKVEVTHRDFDIQQELLDRYKAENAKLREELEAVKHDLQVFSANLVRLGAENAKLRELLADTLMQPHDYCQKYGIEYDGWDSVNDHLDARMRELGVEE